MNNNDYTVGQVYMPQSGALNKKPCYLITLENKKNTQYFISIDKPVFESYFIQAKGVFSELSENEIGKQFQEIINIKDNIVEIFFPSHRIISIKNLAFNANKPATINR